MAFKPGVPRHPNAGRKKGTPNKRTQELIEILDKHNFNPAERMIKYCNTLERIIKTRLKHGNLAGAIIAIEKAGSIAGDLAQYTYPKKKAIEHSGEVGVRTFADFIAAGEPEEPK